MDLSKFLPNSVREQWLTAQSPDELSVCLDEVMDLYFQQSSQNRLSSEENVSGIVGEVLENIFNFPSEFSVVSKGLTLLEMIAMDFSWQCVHHFENLSSLIQRYLNDSKAATRLSAYRLGAVLASSLSFDVTGPFVSMLATELQSSIAPNFSARLIALALMHSSLNQVHSAVTTYRPGGDQTLSADVRAVLDGVFFVASSLSDFHADNKYSDVVSPHIGEALALVEEIFQILIILFFREADIVLRSRVVAVEVPNKVAAKMSHIVATVSSSLDSPFTMYSMSCKRQFPLLRSEPVTENHLSIFLDRYPKTAEPGPAMSLNATLGLTISTSPPPSAGIGSTVCTPSTRTTSRDSVNSAFAKRRSRAIYSSVSAAKDSAATCQPVSARGADYIPSWSDDGDGSGAPDPMPSGAKTPDSQRLQTLKKNRNYHREFSSEPSTPVDGVLPENRYAEYSNECVLPNSITSRNRAQSESVPPSGTSFTARGTEYSSLDSHPLAVNSQKSWLESKDADSVPIKKRNQLHGTFRKANSVDSGPLHSSVGASQEESVAPALSLGEDRPIKPMATNIRESLEWGTINENEDMRSPVPRGRNQMQSTLRAQDVGGIHGVSVGKKLDRTKSNSKPTVVTPRASAAESGVDDGMPSASTGIEYLASSDIQPSQQPKKDLQRVLKIFEKPEWPEIFDSLNLLRGLSLHHRDLLVASGSLQFITRAVSKQMDNLRSAVSKNAILTVCDMFTGLGRQMDPEVPTIISVLLKRCGDTSGFLEESADAAVSSMIVNVSVLRVLSGLLLGVEHKTPAIRGKSAGFLFDLIQQRHVELASVRETDAIKPKLSRLFGDSNPEARSAARRIVCSLLEHNVFSREEIESLIGTENVEKSLQGGLEGPSPSVSARVSEQSISTSTPKKSRLARMPSHIEESSDNGLGSDIVSPRVVPDRKGMMAKRSVPDHSLPSPAGRKAAAAKRAMETNEDLIALPDTIRKASSSVWTDRRDALTAVTNVINMHSEVLKDSNKLESSVEVILDHLDDGSPKVSMHALTCVQTLLLESPSVMQTLSLMIVPALLVGISSSNKPLSTTSLQVLKEYLQGIPSIQAINQLCTAAQHDKDKCRVAAFHVLADCMGRYCDGDDFTASGISRRLVFPAITFALFTGTTKTEVKTSAGEALKSLQRCAFQAPNQERLWTWLSDKKQQDEIKRITSSL